jgi:mono/diheme cytochrome c family protein
MATHRVTAAWMLVAGVFVVTAAGISGQPPAAKPPAGNSVNGRELFIKMSCHYCHGTEGQGSIAGVGPRVALVSRSYDSFARYVRQPAGRMTGYSEKILPEPELIDIYAFLRSLPAARPVSAIPLLDQMRKK